MIYKILTWNLTSLPRIFLCVRPWDENEDEENVLEGDWLKVRRRRAVCRLMKLLLPHHCLCTPPTLPHFSKARHACRCLHTNFLSGHLAQ